MNTVLRKGWCPGALRPMLAKDGLLVRLRITGGSLTARQARAMADLAECCGNGLLDLSARGNLQMRGVHETTLDRLQNGLLTLGLLDSDAGAEAVRNVVASPLAGLHDGLDIRPLVSDLEARLVADAKLHALPPKFGFLIDDGSRPSLAEIEADIRFDLDGDDFVVGIGGDRGGSVPISRCSSGTLVDEAVRVAQVFIRQSTATTGIHRMRDLGREALRNAFRASPHTDLPGASASSRSATPLPLAKKGGGGEARDHATRGQSETRAFPSEEEKQGALAVVGLRTFFFTRGSANPMPVLGLAAPFGRLDTGMLHAAARLAETSGLGELRLTPWRVILVPGVREAIDSPGFITDPSDPRLSIAACVGNAGCARATTDVTADASGLASAIMPGADVVLHVSGCAKGCAKAAPTAITLVGREGRYDVVRDGRAGDPPWRTNLDLAAVRETLRAFA